MIDTKQIWFTKDTHSYFINSNGKTNSLESVSKFIKRFYDPYDEEYWLDYKTCEAFFNNFKMKDGKYEKAVGFYKLIEKHGLESFKLKYLGSQYDIIKNNIKQQWRIKNLNSTTKGSEFHAKREQEDIMLETILYNNIEYPVILNTPTIGDNQYFPILKDGCYLEYLIFNEEYNIAGQLDKLLVYNHKGIIQDYKTNEKLNYNAFQNKTMKYPFNKLPDTNYYHYTVQLSAYAWMLEQHGLIIDKLCLLYKDAELPIQYIKDEIQEALKIKKDEKSHP